MKLVVLSDLHIESPEDPAHRHLIRILKNEVQPGDTVVLAGDIFELFLGAKKFYCERYSELLGTIKASAASGVRYHYIEGNHDFHLKRVFEEFEGVELHSDSVELSLEGKKFYVAHGDQADRKDYGYRLLRSFFRSPFIKGFIKSMPGRWIHRIGEWSSSTSQKVTPRMPTDLNPAALKRLRETYRSYAESFLENGYDYVIMGHCHDLDEHQSSSGQYINMGYPPQHDRYLEWRPGDPNIRRVTFSN